VIVGAKVLTPEHAFEDDEADDERQARDEAGG
jgi:hypothetical protein